MGCNHQTGKNDGTCANCDDKCETCSKAGECETCKLTVDGKKTHRNTADCSCQEGYFDNGELICVKCPYKCETCKSAKKCDKCAPGRVGKDCACPDGQWDDGKKCQKCCSKCATC